MLPRADLASSGLAADTRGVDSLKRAAREDSPEALRAVAKQFEAIFMNMVMKSMREATPKDDLMDNEQSRLYSSMLDQQLSQSLASRGVGLAEALVRQLGARMAPGAAPPGQAPAAEAPAAAAPSAEAPAAAPAATSPPAAGAPRHVQDFQEKLMPHAAAAAQATGVPAQFMLGQAALESGWGRREIRAADGTTSHNLFGIKADRAWTGKTVEAVTTEYVNGVPQKTVEKFRAYDSYADAFRDYASFLTRNPRYRGLLASAQDATSFAQGLQKAGYATDPDYASKLTRIIRQTRTA